MRLLYLKMVIPAILVIVESLPQTLVNTDYGDLDDLESFPRIPDPVDFEDADTFSDSITRFKSDESSLMLAQNPSPVESKYKISICCDPSNPDHPTCSICEFSFLQCFWWSIHSDH